MSASSGFEHLIPGQPIPIVREERSGYERVGWRRFALVAVLFVTVVAINTVIALPPIASFPRAVDGARELFFGQETLLPWEKS